MTVHSITISNAAISSSAGARLESLDVFRGATIAAMILVNNPGDWAAVYPPLLHSPWHGWTFTDLIFPFFLWIAGAAMTFSLAGRIERGDSRGALLAHLLRRAAILFVLGLFLNAFPYFRPASLRIPGVLQRIALCCLIAGAIYLYSTWKAQAACIAGLLAVYWALLTLVPVPGHGPGVLEQNANLAAYFDGLLLDGHMWRQTGTWDPEGILSTLSAIATVLFGILAGQLLRSPRSREAKTAALLAAGVSLAAAGELMSRWMPINKNLWTSSYAVFMAGAASLVFAACFWLVDVQGCRRWAKPLAIYGRNAIAVYMLSELLETLDGEIRVSGQSLHAFLFRTLYEPLASPRIASLLWALTWVLALYLAAWLVYRKRWFLRV